MSEFQVKRKDEEIYDLSDRAQAIVDGEVEEGDCRTAQTILDLLAWLQGSKSDPL